MITETTDRITSKNHIRMPVPHAGQDLEFFVFSGIAIFSLLKGENSDWVEANAIIQADYSEIINSDVEGIRVSQSTININLSSLYNKSHAINTGWAVDNFWLPTVPDQNADNFCLVGGTLTMNARVALRDIDAHILRLSYQTVVIGEVAQYQVGVID